MSSASGAAGPTSHFELFAGLRDHGVGYLVTGATALVLHGVPRLTPDVDLVVDSSPENLERLARLLAAWGFGEASPSAEGPAPRRYRNPRSALGEIDVVPLPAGEFSRLLAGAPVAALVDVEIPFVDAAHLLGHKDARGDAADRPDAEGLRVLASIRAGETGSPDDTLREQIRKFSRWSVAARLDWLLAAARLARGMSPEARPMTRGLVRRRGWYGR